MAIQNSLHTKGNLGLTYLIHQRTALANNNPFLTHLEFSFKTTKYLVFVMDLLPGGFTSSSLHLGN